MYGVPEWGRTTNLPLRSFKVETLPHLNEPLQTYTNQGLQRNFTLTDQH